MQPVPYCPKCRGPLKRIHRGFFHRRVYSALYACRDCHSYVGHFHPFLLSTYRFIFSRYTRCIRCGSDNVHRMYKRDRIDNFSKNPLSWLQRFLAAPLNKCPACRLQYYDWRRPRPSDLQPASQVEEPSGAQRREP